MCSALKAKRKSIGLTQAQIAQKADISERTYKRYETDRKSKEHRKPQVDIAIKIANALGIENLRELWNVDN